MENETAEGNTPEAKDTTGLAGDTTGRRSPEWTGGHEAPRTAAQDADLEILPEHEDEEGTTAQPGNS